MKKKINYFKIASAVFYIVLICVLAFHVRDVSAETLLSYSPENKLLAALFVLLLFCLKSLSVVFPIVVLQVLSGFLFPPAAALFVNCLGTMLCYTVPYIIGRLTGAAAAEARIQKNEKLRMIVNSQRNHKFFLSFFLRVISCLPADLISMYLGALKIPYRQYITASLLGTLPGLIPATFIGKNITVPRSPEFLAALLCTVICSVGSILIFFLYTKKHRKSK